MKKINFLIMFLFLIFQVAFAKNSYIWLSVNDGYYNSCIVIVDKESYEVQKTVCKNFWHIVDIASHPKENKIAFVDKHAHAFYYMDHQGNIILQKGSDTSGPFRAPWQVEIDFRNNNFYVLDTYYNGVLKLNEKAIVTDLIKGFSYNDGSGFYGSELIIDYNRGMFWSTNRFGRDYQIKLFDSYGHNHANISGINQAYGIDINQKSGQSVVSGREQNYILNPEKLEQFSDIEDCLGRECSRTKESKKIFSKIAIDENSSNFWAIENLKELSLFNSEGVKLKTIKGFHHITDIDFDESKNILWVSSSSLYNKDVRYFFLINENVVDGYVVKGGTGPYHKVLDLKLPTFSNSKYPVNPFRIEIPKASIDRIAPVFLKGKISLENSLKSKSAGKVEIVDFKSYKTQANRSGEFNLKLETPGSYIAKFSAPCHGSNFIKFNTENSMILPSQFLKLGPTTFDFETFSHGYSSVSGFDWGSPNKSVPCYSGKKCLVTDLYRPYQASQKYVSYSSQINLKGMKSPTLEIYSYFDTDYTDGGNVNITINGTLVPLIPEGGYPVSSVKALNGLGGFSGKSNGWIKYRFDLTPFMYFPELKLVYYFTSSENSMSGAGWMVDNISVFDSKSSCK